ncbi:MAG: hypothetical protein WC551_10270 [Patescibacteria group bacterium]
MTPEQWRALPFGTTLWFVDDHYSIIRASVYNDCGTKKVELHNERNESSIGVTLVSGCKFSVEHFHICLNYAVDEVREWMEAERKKIPQLWR